MQADSSMTELIHPEYNFTKAEVVWCVQHEMAVQVEDILARRSRILFVNASAAISSSAKVARWMADVLKKDGAWVEQQISAFEDMAKGYLPS